MYFYTTYILNLRIGSENKKRGESGYSKGTAHMKLTCAFFYNSLSKFALELDWRTEKKRESGYSKGTVHMKLTCAFIQLTF